jgi:hypothetical protein
MTMNSTHQAKTEVAAALVVDGTIRRPAAPGAAVPATAPSDPAGVRPCPRAAIGRCAVVVVMMSILHPFPDVAVHVIRSS